MIHIEIDKNSKDVVLYSTPKKVRYILSYGGRGGGKSYGVMRAEVINLAALPYYRGFLMRNVLDTVRDSVFQEAVDRVGEYKLPVDITESNLLLKCGDNQLKGRGFKKSSGSDTAKNKSVAGINRLVIEEAEEIDKEDFNQLDLSLRTNKAQIIINIIFNPPVKGHWILKEWFDLVPATKENAYTYFKRCWFEDVNDNDLENFFLMVPKNRVDTVYRFSTFFDNLENLNDATIRKMKSYLQDDVEYYLHKICGLVPSGKIGRVFKEYQIIDEKEYDDLAYEKHYGLDFGYTNDPTACVEVKIHNKNIYIKEILYETNLTNPHIAEKLQDITQVITADASEPKSIEELNQLGLYTKGAKKGVDSVTNGIQKIKQYKIHLTSKSLNIMKEFENYTYKLDRNKEPTNLPIDQNNHAIDAIRYAIEDIDNQNYTQSIYF